MLVKSFREMSYRCAHMKQGTRMIAHNIPRQKAMDLLIHIFGPVDPDMQHAVLSRFVNLLSPQHCER